MKKIIINADDFGQTLSCTEGIIEAFKKGYITDTTMVANGEAFMAAAKAIKDGEFEDRIGIHFVLTEGKPLSNEIKSCSRFVTKGEFNGQICCKKMDKIKKILPLTKKEYEAIYIEWKAQIEKVLNAGIKISHADSHHHVHTLCILRPIFMKVCKEYGIKKIRPSMESVNQSQLTKYRNRLFKRQLYKNGFNTVDYFCRASELTKGSLPEGTIEFMLHPDFDKEGRCIDRVDKSSFPIGVPLKKLAESWNSFEKTSYKEFCE